MYRSSTTFSSDKKYDISLYSFVKAAVRAPSEPSKNTFSPKASLNSSGSEV